MTERGIDKRKWNPAIQPTRILETVAEAEGLKVQDLTGKSRKADIVRARDMAVYLLREDLRASFKTIGEILGGRDHSTIITSRCRIENKLTIDPDLLETISSLRRTLQPSELPSNSI